MSISHALITICQGMTETIFPNFKFSHDNPHGKDGEENFFILMEDCERIYRRSCIIRNQTQKKVAIAKALFVFASLLASVSDPQRFKGLIDFTESSKQCLYRQF
jgi:hypothetical protein